MTLLSVGHSGDFQLKTYVMVKTCLYKTDTYENEVSAASKSMFFYWSVATCYVYTHLEQQPDMPGERENW